MASPSEALLAKVQAAYQQLSAAATTLNTASDELGKSIIVLDSALKTLNLGVSAWITVSSDPCSGPFFRTHQIGYDKIAGKWGIALRTVSGNEGAEDESDVEAWLFNDGPRNLRIAAIEKMPELIETLTKEATATAKKITAKLGEAKLLAAAINSVAAKR